MGVGGVRWHEYASGDELAAALAEAVAEQLRGAIRARGRVTLAVSGGSTPRKFFDALSRQELRWDRMKLTIVDERFVHHTSERSNERLVREHLLVANAAKVSFHPLCWGDRPNDRKLRDLKVEAAAADRLIRPLGSPLDVVVLGMGGDGHTASFFPDAPNLAELTDPEQVHHVLPVEAPSGVEPRLTLTMPLIATARFLVLHIEGEEKRRVLDRVIAGAAQLPIGAVLKHAATPVHIYWAPSEGAKP